MFREHKDKYEEVEWQSLGDMRYIFLASKSRERYVINQIPLLYFLLPIPRIYRGIKFDKYIIPKNEIVTKWLPKELSKAKKDKAFHIGQMGALTGILLPGAGIYFLIDYFNNFFKFINQTTHIPPFLLSIFISALIKIFFFLIIVLLKNKKVDLNRFEFEKESIQIIVKQPFFTIFKYIAFIGTLIVMIPIDKDNIFTAGAVNAFLCWVRTGLNPEQSFT
ncbi:hypothetical protein [Floricoccus penangensis]|uniref:hypothetical protein n=1 Tax=Floricoccus penangensis TaxID=1859475 RepID=UPI002041332D|nr:hypothetical protein [Floricoccus penangensis]URZ88139.1 hypothetical protein KIW23_03650 [Floricoccus penangensis]